MGRSPNERFNPLYVRHDANDDQWHPMSSSRRAKWWYSTVHNLTAIVGAGVLGLPYSMSQLGWGPGVTVLILSWAITFYTLWQMIEMHETTDGKRFDRYHELGQHAFGEKLGLYIVIPQQLIVQFGVNVVYTITGGKSLKRFHELVCTNPHCKRIGLTFWILIFGSAHFVLSHFPDLNSISGVSLAATVMSFSYSTIVWATSAAHGSVTSTTDVQYKTTPNVLNFFNALGSMAFAYSGHNVVMEIQATIPSPSKKIMWRGVVLSYVIVALCYFPTAILGYWAFGNKVDEDILISLDKPVWLLAAANMFVVIHLIGGYQIYAMPVFDLMERLFIYRFRFQPSKRLSFILRNVYVAFTIFIAMAMPFFEGLMGFFGGFAFAPTTYFLPCIIWLVIYKPHKFSYSWWTNWVFVVLGMALMVVAAIGGLYQIIQEAKRYKFFSDPLNKG